MILQKQFISDDYINEVNAELFYELADRKLRINVEYYVSNLAYVSIVDAETNEDCIKTCIEKGMFYAEYRKEKKLESLVRLNSVFIFSRFKKKIDCRKFENEYVHDV